MALTSARARSIDTPGRSRPMTGQPRALRELFGGSMLLVTQTSVSEGKLNPGGITPTTSQLTPSIFSLAALRSARPPSSRCQKP